MATSPRQNELLQLQNDITSEVQRDAPAIAQGVFGDNKNHPDMANVSNQQYDDLVRQKYMLNDRQWLQAEAQRDPQQFLDVAQRIGVTLPQPGQPSTAVDPNAFAQQAQQNPTLPHTAGPVLPPALPAGTPGPMPAGPVPPMSTAAPAPPTIAPGPSPIG